MRCLMFCGAGDGARTRYLHLGKVALYQMSYARRTILSIAGKFGFVNPFFEKLSRFLKKKTEHQDGVPGALLSSYCLRTISMISAWSALG